MYNFKDIKNELLSTFSKDMCNAIIEVYKYVFDDNDENVQMFFYDSNLFAGSMDEVEEYIFERWLDYRNASDLEAFLDRNKVLRDASGDWHQDEIVTNENQEIVVVWEGF